MSDYGLNYADGRVTEIVADNDSEAEVAALARFGREAVAACQWDTAGHNDGGEPMERRRPRS